MIIKIGFTQSDQSIGYSSFAGYREGAEQKLLTIDLTDEALPLMDTEAIAEAVFEATNHPEAELLKGVPGRIFHAIYDPNPAYVRSLSTGDTVELPERGERVACESFGWKLLEVAK